MTRTIKAIAWIVWGIAMAWGVYGVVQRLLHGERNVNYGSYIPWGLLVVGKVYLIGLGVGTSMFAWIVYAFGLKKYFSLARQALLASVIAVLMGMTIIAFDLGHMWRSFEVFYRPQFRSLIAWASWFAVINIAYAGIVFYFDIAAKLTPAGRRALGWIGIFLAIAFSGCNGAEFAGLIAHPYWNSTLGPILSIGGDLLSGFALMLFIASCFHKELLQGDQEPLARLGRVVLGLIVALLILQWSEFSISAWYGVGQVAGLYRKLLFGSGWYLFWGVQLLLGCFIPAVLLLWQPGNRSVAGLAALLVTAAFLAARYNLVLPGQTTPTFEGLEQAYTDAHLTFEYYPSAREWSLLVFCVALGIGMFVVARRLLLGGFLSIPVKGGQYSYE